MNNLNQNAKNKIDEFIFYTPSAVPRDMLRKLYSSDITDTEKLILIKNFRRYELSLKSRASH